MTPKQICEATADDGFPRERPSLIARGASWLILKLLSFSLLAVIVGLGFSGWKYLNLVDELPPPPAFSPAAVAASSIPPVDYHRHPVPAGLTAPVQVPFVEPPLPHSVHVQQPAHAPLHPAHRPARS